MTSPGIVKYMYSNKVQLPRRAPARPLVHPLPSPNLPEGVTVELTAAVTVEVGETGEPSGRDAEAVPHPLELASADIEKVTFNGYVHHEALETSRWFP